MASKSLSQTEIQEFLNDAKKQQAYKMVGHSWTQKKNMSKQICKNCGLVRLNNKFTQWAVDKGCMNELHSGYKAARARYTGEK